MKKLTIKSRINLKIKANEDNVKIEEMCSLSAVCEQAVIDVHYDDSGI